MPTERLNQYSKPRLREPRALNRLARRFIVWLYTHARIAPAEVVNIDNSLERASELLNQGYGLWILGTHFSKREGFDMDILPAQFIPELNSRILVSPISLHQRLDHPHMIDFVSWLTAATITPVVNADAMKENNRNEAERRLKREITLGEGVRPYARLVGEATRKGGAAAIAPQAGRRTSLELSQAKAKTVEYLLALSKTERDSKLAFLFMSMSPMEKVDYEEIKDSFNLKMKYKITFATLTLSEIYDLLDKVNERLAISPIEEKKQLSMDELILIILSLPISPDYNKIDPAYADLLASTIEIDAMEAIPTQHE